MNRLYIFFALLFPSFVFAQANTIPAQVHRVTSVASATSSHITVNAIAKGFAANDPFRPVQAKITPAKLLKFARAGGGAVFRFNPWWLAATAALGYVLTEDGQPAQEQITYRGRCTTYNKPNVWTNITVEQCGANLAALKSSQYDTYTYTHYTVENSSVLNVWGKDSYGSAPIVIGQLSQYSQSSGGVTPVSDADFIESIIPYISQNAAPEMFGDDYSKLEWEPLEYNPYADDPLTAGQMEQYRQGLLQHTDPSADYYVTPQRYQEIADKVAEQDKSKTDAGQAEEMNEEANRPATNQDFVSAGEQFATTTAPAASSIADKKTEMDDFFGSVPDLVGGDIPGTPGGIAGVPLPTEWATGMNGSCIPLAIDISVGPFQKTTSWDAHCAPYDAVFRPVVEWFLMILTGLYLFRLWDDTVSKVAGM